MPIIKIERLHGGLARDYVGGNTASVEGKRSNEYARSNGIDLYRPGFDGHLTPAQIFSTGSMSSNVDSLPRAVAVDITNLSGAASVPFLFFILGGLKATAPRVVRASTPLAYDSHQVIGSPGAHSSHNFTADLPNLGFWGEDIIFYQVNGTNYIFYSWNDNTDGDVGRATLAGSYDDDFMTTVPSGASTSGFPTTGVPRRLLEGPDKILYITNGRYVASFDGSNGSNGTVNYQAYDLGVGWVAVDLKKDGNNVIVVSNRAGASYVNYSFLSESKSNYWNGTEPGLGIVTEPDDNFVSAILPVGNTTYAFTRGKNASMKLKRLQGNKFVTIPGREQDVGLYGTPPDPRSIDVYRNLMLWSPGNSAGAYLMAYDLENDGIHIPFIVNDGTNDATTVGMVKNIDGNNLYVGVLIAGVYKILYTNGNGGYASAKDLRLCLKRLTFKATIKRITVYFSQMASGSSARFSLFKNYTASSIGTSGTDFLNKTIDYATYGTRTEIELNDKAITDVSSFYMNVRLTGQISIPLVEIEWGPSQTQS